MNATATRVHVDLAGRAYDIVIGSDLLENAGALLKPVVAGRDLIVISDENVAALYLEKLQIAIETGGLKRPEAVVVPPGEGSKSIESFGRAAESLLGLGVDRRSIILALGGGAASTSSRFRQPCWRRSTAPSAARPPSIASMART
jgi:3-dehydroquinate synthetase